MEIAKIRVRENSVKILKLEKIPSGLIGGYITVEYDALWSELDKQVVFRGNVEKPVFTNEKVVEIPKEVIAKPGTRLQIGFIGTDKSRYIPSFYVDLGVVLQGTDSSGDPSMDQSLPAWAQLTQRMGELEDKVENGFTGPPGETPEISIGEVATLSPDEPATATITGTPEKPILNLGIPKGEPSGGSGGNVDYGANNAGKLLYVGADGFATVLALGAGLAIVDGVLTITSQVVISAICGQSVCGNAICGGA